MNNFEMYVKSSALGKTGIHWRRIISEENQPREKHDLIQDPIIEGKNSQSTTINDLIDVNKPSLLIFINQDKNKLLLEVTGIESTQSSEKLGRKVLNSVVWIAENSEENEKVLRKIAYRAIQSILDENLTLSKTIGESIDFFDLEEFRVNLEKINEFIKQIEHDIRLGANSTESDEKSKIEGKSKDNLEKLAEEILNNPLPKKWTSWDGTPKKDGVLVVVTENLEKRTILHQAGVWRGFASRVEVPAIESVPLSEKKKKTIPSLQSQKVKQPTFPPPPNQKIRLIIILLIAGMAILLILISLKILFQPKQTKILIPQPTQVPKIQCQQEEMLKTQENQLVKSQPQIIIPEL